MKGILRRQNSAFPSPFSSASLLYDCRQNCHRSMVDESLLFHIDIIHRGCPWSYVTWGVNNRPDCGRSSEFFVLTAVKTSTLIVWVVTPFLTSTYIPTVRINLLPLSSCLNTSQINMTLQPRRQTWTYLKYISLFSKNYFFLLIASNSLFFHISYVGLHILIILSAPSYLYIMDPG
jgi:hypothetical protein